MSLLLVALIVCVVLSIAYFTYGRMLPRLFNINDSQPTPAVEMEDGEDFVPTEKKFLLGQHFSAIAAAGPILGPILAGLMFGWVPALIWILVGAIFIGGVHDFAALVASIRHKAKSIAEVVREHMNPRAYILFLSFIWLALVYIIVAFTDVTAGAFVGKLPLGNGETVLGGGIASSSLIYLALPILMGLLLRYTKMSLGVATAIFLPLVVGAVWVGQHIPLDLATMLGTTNAQAQKIWGVVILAYCLLAAMAPIWLLLQPRGHLGGFFLYFFLAAGVLGILFTNPSIKWPGFTGWTDKDGLTLAPFLFITIACGAVSGFHALIASGTTSKQLPRESDARPIGYGTMLLEAGVAFLALACVMMLSKADAMAGKPANVIFADGISNFLTYIGIAKVLAMSIMLLAFTTFVYDTLDVCTRLGRYIIQELTGWRDKRGAWIGTSLTALVPLYFLLQQPVDTTGKPVQAWRVFWNLFGASNQLLAALTLLGITAWLWGTRRVWWAWVVTGIPCLFMYCMSCWALTQVISKAYTAEQAKGASGFTPETVVGGLLLFFALWMLVEGVLTFVKPRVMPPIGEPEAAPA